MAVLNETNFLVLLEKNGIIINVDIFKCKELDDWSSYKDGSMWNPSTCDCECNKAYKVDEYLDIKKCLCKKLLFGKLVSGCEDEILNITETSLEDNKITYKIIIILFTCFH